MSCRARKSVRTKPPRAAYSRACRGTSATESGPPTSATTGSSRTSLARARALFSPSPRTHVLSRHRHLGYYHNETDAARAADEGWIRHGLPPRNADKLAAHLREEGGGGGGGGGASEPSAGSGKRRRQPGGGSGAAAPSTSARRQRRQGDADVAGASASSAAPAAAPRDDLRLLRLLLVSTQAPGPA